MRRLLLLLLVFPLLGFSEPPKIYDCFLFAHEIELLEIRLNELYPYVDHFVLVESCETHRKAEPKPLYFELCKERFAPFMDKIIHIALYDHIDSDDGWVRENWQRNQIMRGLTDCSPRDIVMISDVDEFPPGVKVALLPKMLKTNARIVFVQKMYRWFLNRTTGELWQGTGVVRYKDLVKLSPQGVRNLARSGLMATRHAGWHFTSMGGYKKIVEKYHNIVEGYDTVIDEATWREQVNSHKRVPIDATYPKFVQEHIDYLIQTDLIDTDPTQT